MENSNHIKILIELKDEIEREIYTLKNIIFTKENTLEKLTDKLLYECNHNWIRDHIDIDVERTEMVKYCDKCHLTYNTNTAL